jgi:hypothetical protein
VGEAGRLPGLVIVGAMKSATTSLFQWLDEQPEVVMAHPKETRFFTDHWSLGLSWYSAKFAEATPDQLLGEASQNYTNPRLSADAADRMARTIPQARLIYIVRHPVDRLRSHYRHEVQRAREPRPLVDALREPGNLYAGQSSYFTCLRPYIDRFPREQIFVCRFEDLTRDPAPAWAELLRWLSLSERPRPEAARNVGAENAQWTRAMAWAKRHGLISLKRVSRLPSPVRRAGRLLLARGGDSYERRLAASSVEIPEGLIAPMWEDVARFEDWLGTPLWSGDSGPERAGAS